MYAVSRIVNIFCLAKRFKPKEIHRATDSIVRFLKYTLVIGKSREDSCFWYLKPFHSVRYWSPPLIIAGGQKMVDLCKGTTFCALSSMQLWFRLAPSQKQKKKLFRLKILINGPFVSENAGFFFFNLLNGLFLFYRAVKKQKKQMILNESNALPYPTISNRFANTPSNKPDKSNGNLIENTFCWSVSLFH